MARIRQSDIDEVKARVNIADVVGERVALKSAGVGSMNGVGEDLHSAANRPLVAAPERGTSGAYA